MGCDVAIEEMLALVPHDVIGPSGYAFAINNNGYVVFHPNLRAQRGWLADPPNVDLLEVEHDSPEMKQARTGSGRVASWTVAAAEGHDYEPDVIRRVERPSRQGGRGGCCFLRFRLQLALQVFVDDGRRKIFFTGVGGTPFNVGVVLPHFVGSVLQDAAVTADALAPLLTSPHASVFVPHW